MLSVMAALPAQAKLPRGLDATFGNHGVAFSRPIPHELGSWALAEGAGRIVTSSSYENQFRRKKPIRSTLYLAEFDPEGKRVNSFGRDGVVTYKPGAWVIFYDVAVDPQGRVLLIMASSHTNNFYEQSLELLRLRADGIVDESFNAGKPLVLKTSDMDDLGDSTVKFASDSSIYLYSATLNEVPVLYKVTPAGALDPTYAAGGKLAMPVNDSDSPEAMFDEVGKDYNFDVLAADGSVYISTDEPLGNVGPSRDDFGYRPQIYRFDPSGQLDATYGTGGLVTIKRPEREAHPNAVGLRADGGLTAVLFMRDTKKKRRISKSASVILNGATVTATSSFPLTKIHTDVALDSYRIWPDGSIAQLVHDERQFELTTTWADGKHARRHKRLVLPKALGSYWASVIDSSGPRSVLIGGGRGKRLTVLRFRPSG